MDDEVLVIGAGLSGLTAAALLADRGLSVTVLEQHYQPGGSCGAFRRRDVTFDQGTAMFFGFGSRGFNPHRFVMNELAEPIEIIKHEVLYTLRYGGVPITFYPELEAFYRELARLFAPEEVRQIRAFYEYIGRLYHGVIAANPVCVAPSELHPREGLKLLLRNPLKQLQLLRLLKRSAGDLMRRFITSEGVIRFFNKLTSTYCYTLVDETPAIMAVTMFMDNHFGGSYYPIGSSQVLPGRLEKALEERGGRILYGLQARELLFDDRRATGVRASGPAGVRTLEGADFVYGGTIWNLYGGLVPERVCGSELSAWAADLIPTYPSVVLHTLVEAWVIPQGTGPIEMLADNPEAIDEKEITLYMFSLADSSICPPGTHTVMAIGPSLRSWPKPGSADYRSRAYEGAKREETERILATLERRFPGFRRAVRYHTLATPTTIERYTLKNGGAVAGPKQAMGQELLHRPHASTRWPNLFLCGESTVMGTGSPAVTISGISAANMVLRRRGLEEYSWRPGQRNMVVQRSARHLNGEPRPHVVRANAISDPVQLELHDQAALCQWCEGQPCVLACPAGLDIRGILRRVEMGNLVGAQRVLASHGGDALPCMVCISPAQAAPCEGRCLRLSFDSRPVPIRRVMLRLDGSRAARAESDG